MSYLRLTILFAFASFAHLPLNAVDVVTRGIKNPALFGVEFPGDARSYHAREASVLSISKQEYVTAAFRVLEVNIVTDGPALLRVYYSRPLRAGELTSALGDAAGAAGAPGSSIIQTPLPPQIKSMAERGNKVTDAITSQTVIKEYPLATHAHTIEFRVSKRDELLALHGELKKHWLKEPAFYEGGQISEEGQSKQSEKKPRSLGGTLFRVQE